MDPTKIHDTNDYHMFSEPYCPEKESFRWISVSDLMDLKNILENYKYHTMKEIEDIIGDSQDVFEIGNRSNVLIEVENGLKKIEDCLNPEDSEKAEEEKLSSEKTEDDEVSTLLKNIIDKIYKNKYEEQLGEELFKNPKLVKLYNSYMARNIITGEEDDN